MRLASLRAMPVSLVGVYLRGGRVDALAVCEESLSFEPYAVVLRRDAPDFRLLVGKALDDHNRSGEIDLNFRSWLAPLGSPSFALAAPYLLTKCPSEDPCKCC